MEALERDSTQDWLLPDHARPPLVGELEARIDEALATARASEAAVMTVGAAALDAAEQARRAADLAELASSAMLRREMPAEPVAGSPPPVAEDEVEVDDLRDFTARADRIAARLRELEQGSVAVVG